MEVTASERSQHGEGALEVSASRASESSDSELSVRHDRLSLSGYHKERVYEEQEEPSGSLSILNRNRPFGSAASGLPSSAEELAARYAWQQWTIEFLIAGSAICPDGCGLGEWKMLRDELEKAETSGAPLSGGARKAFCEKGLAEKAARAATLSAIRAEQVQPGSRSRGVLPASLALWPTDGSSRRQYDPRCCAAPLRATLASWTATQNPSPDSGVHRGAGGSQKGRASRAKDATARGATALRIVDDTVGRAGAVLPREDAQVL